ncbi:MAG: hypothetical protein KAS77_12225, partial [Thermoplasmata archaeon]|nr:hypothetical protein [Thermoplasmata archaeon]
IVWNDKVIEPSMVMGPSRPGRKICVAMDTKPILGLPERIRGFDVLIHEATADQSLESKANKFGHSTAAQAATIAKEADVKRLFLIHISPRYRDPKPLIDEARSIFEESYLPSDLEEFEVPLPESWEHDRKMWVVDGKVDEEEAEEGVAAEGELPPEAAEGIETAESLAAAENAEAVEVYDEPAPGEAVVAAVDDVLEEVDPAEVEVPVEEPVPAMSDGGITLVAVEAAMESKAAESEDLQDSDGQAEGSKPKVIDDDDEFDLEQAMRDVGIDPED